MIKKNEVHLFIGQKVRVIYVEEGPSSGMAVIVDQRITPPVLLVDFNSVTNEVTIQRDINKPHEIIKVYELFKAE